MEAVEGNANGGSTYEQQSYIARKLRQYQAKYGEEMTKKQQDIQSSIAHRVDDLKKRHEVAQKELEAKIKKQGEDLVAKQQKESKEAELEVQRKWKERETNIKKEYEEMAKKQLPPHQVAQRQQEIQLQVVKYQQEDTMLGQTLQQKYMQEHMTLQQDVLTQQQKFQQKCLEDHQELQAKIQREMKELEENMKQSMEKDRKEIFEPDPKFNGMSLSDDQKREFVEKGYVKIPNVVPKELVQDALRMINYGLSLGFKREELLTFRRPEVEGSEAIVNLLYKSPALALARSMIGDTHPCWGGQIALRFPGHFCTADPFNSITPFKPADEWYKHWHIDGLNAESKGHPKGHISNFTCLLGVILNDLPEKMSGNLAVYPGSHNKLQQAVQKQGVECMLNPKVHENIELGEPEQITGSAGDIVIVHYQTGHNVAPNISSSIRYAVYFRVFSTQHQPDTFRPEAMLDIWKDWKNLDKFTKQ